MTPKNEFTKQTGKLFEEVLDNENIQIKDKHLILRMINHIDDLEHRIEELEYRLNNQ